ncbi:MAG: hypothetical protein ACOZB3_07820 [Calditrichota bacterium]
MKKRLVVMAALSVFALLMASCDEGADDWNSSAKISGYVYTDATHTQGLEGVQVILESDPAADNPYEGPDKWVTTDANGYFECNVFLGNTEGEYNYLADMSAGYFWQNQTFAWDGGITVSPGSHFTCPAVDASMFVPYSGGGQ